MKYTIAVALAALLTAHTAAIHEICKGGGFPDNISVDRFITHTDGWRCSSEFLELDEQISTIPAGDFRHEADGVDTVI